MPLPDRALAAADAKQLRAEYEKRYEAQFGLRIADVPVEFLTWSVHVATGVAGGKKPPGKITPSKAAANGRMPVFDPVRGKVEAIPSYHRAALRPGARLAGPALIVEPQTSTLVPRGWRCRIGATGHLIIETT